MRRYLALLIGIALLLGWARRLPAPISEQSTPSPTAPPKSTKTETVPEGAKPGDIIAKITHLETKWEGCVPSHDLSVIRSLVADDFSGVSSRGKIVNKSQLLEEFGKDSDTYFSASNQDLNVQVHSDSMAVAIGTAHEGRKIAGWKALRPAVPIHGYLDVSARPVAMYREPGDTAC